MSRAYKAAAAVYAAAVAGLGAMAAVLVGTDERAASIGDLSDGQWVTVLLAALTAGGGILGLNHVGDLSAQRNGTRATTP